MNILFLCTGNSCRSLISEAIFNHLAPAGWKAISAGSQPTGKLNERALALLESKGIPTAGYYSKSWDQLPVTPDIVVTVCGSAAAEACPAYLGPVLRTHWGVDDPSHVTGSEQVIADAFEQAYAILRARIEAFLALPLDQLAADRSSLKAELDRIGEPRPTNS
jgi:arsenate reductase